MITMSSILEEITRITNTFAALQASEFQFILCKLSIVCLAKISLYRTSNLSHHLLLSFPLKQIWFIHKHDLASKIYHIHTLFESTDGNKLVLQKLNYNSELEFIFTSTWLFFFFCIWEKGIRVCFFIFTILQIHLGKGSLQDIETCTKANGFSIVAACISWHAANDEIFFFFFFFTR